MFDVDYIKTQYCNYKCKYGKNAEINIKDIDVLISDYKCDQCSEIVDIESTVDVTVELCEYCQINNFIRELQDFKVIK